MIFVFLPTNMYFNMEDIYPPYTEYPHFHIVFPKFRLRAAIIRIIWIAFQMKNKPPAHNKNKENQMRIVFCFTGTKIIKIWEEQEMKI